MNDAQQCLFAGPERTPIRMRGLHIDLCRHYIDVRTVLSLIETMASLRLNALHLHLSDDQALPIELATYPAAHTVPYWTVADQERIAQACRSRGIEVIPEIDIPGHARALLSFFDPSITVEHRLGVVTRETIQIERDLPVVLRIFGELATRFSARRIHMGGDEALQYPHFVDLVTRVCAWARQRSLDVVAWDGVASAFSEFPRNLIVQVWREQSRATVARGRTLLSHGYYLDHVADPFAVYAQSPQTAGDQEGCVACMWTELVTDATIECTIFPSLYMMAHRWWTFPEVDPDPPRLLRRLCEAFGYPAAYPDGWRSRLWADAEDPTHPRATCSVQVGDALTRDHDLYPVYARTMVQITDALYRWVHCGDTLTAPETAMVRAQFCDCFGDDADVALGSPDAFLTGLRAALRAKPPSRLHNNAWDVVLGQLAPR